MVVSYPRSALSENRRESTSLINVFGSYNISSVVNKQTKSLATYFGEIKGFTDKDKTTTENPHPHR